MSLSRASLLLPLCLLFVPYIDCYCTGLGANPGWTSPPIVEQITLTKVRVSWKGLVTREDCADNFLVKYWPVNDQSDFTMTSPMSTDTFEIDISDIRSRREYEYQMIAREDKGLWGIDYNKSGTTRFMTWSGVSTVAPHVPEQATATQSQRTPSSPDQGGQGGQGGREGQGGQGHAGNVTSQTLLAKKEVTVALSGVGVELLAGVVIAGLILLLVLVAIMYNCHKRRRNNKDLEMESNLGSDEESEGDSMEFDGEDEEDEEDSPATSEKESLNGHPRLVD